MASGSDHYRFLVLGANRGKRERCGMRAEINDHISLVYHRAQVVALINLAGHLKLVNVSGAGEKRLAHPAFRTSDDDAGHFSSFSRFIVSRSVSRFFGFMGTSGSRY